MDLKEKLVSANVYLGAAAIVEALGNGADVVITGRVADPAIFTAPAVHEFGWEMDDWGTLGRAPVRCRTSGPELSYLQGSRRRRDAHPGTGYLREIFEFSDPANGNPRTELKR